MCGLPVDRFSLGDIRQFEHGPVGHHASPSGILRFSVSYKILFPTPTQSLSFKNILQVLHKALWSRQWLITPSEQSLHDGFILS